MSLPLTRRIAKTVLLTAAGAASVVGAAGAASAAELPTTADVGGLSNLDKGVGGDVAGTASEGAQALTPMSSTTPLDTNSVPDAGVRAGTDNARAGQEAAKLVGNTASGAQTGMQKQTPNVQQSLPNVQTQGLPTDSLGQLGQPGQATPAQSTPAQSTPAKGTPAKTQPANGQGNNQLLGGKVLPNGLGTIGLGGSGR
ncbi:ATP-binding protein [Streptomyces winkii]|uniref:ATP-binding protein n=1 Tax=Streptomyces winkii TaxID=3051178 RepID=UPI0037D9C2DB